MLDFIQLTLLPSPVWTWPSQEAGLRVCHFLISFPTPLLPTYQLHLQPSKAGAWGEGTRDKDTASFSCRGPAARASGWQMFSFMVSFGSLLRSLPAAPWWGQCASTCLLVTAGPPVSPCVCLCHTAIWAGLWDSYVQANPGHLPSHPAPGRMNGNATDPNGPLSSLPCKAGAAPEVRPHLQMSLGKSQALSLGPQTPSSECGSLQTPLP